MYRIIALAIGYAFGNILTGEIIARQFMKKSAFRIGSGNPGMANVMAQGGFRNGIYVLIGDIMKTMIACLLCRVLFHGGGHGTAAAAWAGLGCVLGHNYPAWHRFSGGKGVTCTCTALFCIAPFWGILAMLAGMIGVFLTQYLPVGGIVIPAVFVLISLFRFGLEITLVIVVLTGIMVLRHLPAIRNIPSGEEKKINVPALIRQKLSGRR